MNKYELDMCAYSFIGGVCVGAIITVLTLCI